MKKNANLNMYIFVSVVFLLFLNFNEILLAADPGDSFLSSITGKDEVFGPVASGSWYPGSESQLKEMVTSYLSNADIGRQASNIKAVISPHAGLSISGRTAAYSFKPLIGQDINRVIVLAPSHYALFRGLSIYKADYYKTPLGLIKIDTGVCENLLKEKLINTVDSAHKKEHSLENMLPFLQLTVKDFKLVPILVGQLKNRDYKILSNILKNYVDESTVIVVSSDFTHYGSSYGYMPFSYDENTRENIKNLDEGAIEQITNLDFTGFQQYLDKTEVTICGRMPIGLLLNILSKDVEGKLVKYDTSGNLMKDFRNSVSYASILFF